MHKFHILRALVASAVLLTVSCSSTGMKNENNSAPREETGTGVNVTFCGDSAMTYLKRQVEFGPRVPGSQAHKECADWLAATLAGFGGTVSDATVGAKHPITGKDIQVRNIFARFNPDAKDRVIVLAHYDTRPWADNDPNPGNHNTPIDGANDGASGTAVALELARHANRLPDNKGLDILLVDQEDSGTHDSDESWCIGSRVWVSRLPYSNNDKPRFGILLDMVGGKDAVFTREFFSENYAPQINNMIWEAANKSGYGTRFPDRVGGAINDDHVSLLNAGIPTVDIIETRPEGFNPTWHTLDDNIENIDPETLRIVGEVITSVIYK